MTLLGCVMSLSSFAICFALSSALIGSLDWCALEPDALTRAAATSGAGWSMLGGSSLPLPCEVPVFGVGLDPPTVGSVPGAG